MLGRIYYILSSFIIPACSFLFLSLAARNNNIKEFALLSLTLTVFSYYQVAVDFGSKDYFITSQGRRVFQHDDFVNLVKINILIVTLINLTVCFFNKSFALYLFAFTPEFITTALIMKGVLLKLQLRDETEKYRFVNYCVLLFLWVPKLIVLIATKSVLFSIVVSGICSVIFLSFIINRRGWLPVKLIISNVSFMKYKRYITDWKCWFPFFISSLSFILYFNSDKLIVAYYLGEEKLAIYTVATVFISVGELVCVCVWSLLMSKMHIISNDYRLLNRLKIVAAIGGVLYFAVVFITSKMVISQVFGVLFLSAENIAILLSVFFVFRYVNLVYELIVVYEERQLFLAKARLFCGLMNVILNVLFIPAYGLKAAACSTILSEVVLLGIFICDKHKN